MFEQFYPARLAVVSPLIAVLLLLLFLVSSILFSTRPLKLRFVQPVSNGPPRRLPSGPPGLPIVGNLFQVLRARREPKYGANYVGSIAFTL